MNHSKKFERVKTHFLSGNWTEEMVYAATKSYKKREAWITTEEAEEIVALKNLITA